MTIDEPPAPLQSILRGAGGLGMGGLSAGVGDGLAGATGEALGDGEWRSDPLATPTLHALTHISSAARPASRPIQS